MCSCSLFFSLPLIFTLVAAVAFPLFLPAALKFLCFSSNEIGLLWFFLTLQLFLCYPDNEINVSVKSKLQHPPPRAYPGHLTPLSSGGGGNLIIRVFQGVGNLIPVCQGWGI